MMIKFVSKASNYTIALRHGIPAEPIIGRSAIPGTYIKFEGGSVSVPEDIAEELRKHPRFNVDFRCIDDLETPVDPYSSMRKDPEPDHIISNMENGYVKNVQQSKDRVKLSPEQMKIVTDIATEMAKEMAKEIAKNTLQNMVAVSSASSDGYTVKDTSEYRPVETETSAPVVEDLPESFNGKVDLSQGEEVDLSMEEVAKLAENEVAYVCDKCGKIAKSKAGLAAHRRNCKE